MRAYIAVACFGVLLTMLTMLPKTQKEQKVSVTRSVLGVLGSVLGEFVTINHDFYTQWQHLDHRFVTMLPLQLGNQTCQCRA